MILTALALTSSADLADRLAATADVLIGATLLLAAVAAVVALLAYAVSTGLPDINIHTEFNDSPANNPIFIGENRAHEFICWPRERTSFLAIRKILLRNLSAYSATNPAFVIRFKAMALRPLTPDDDNWTVTDTTLLPGHTKGLTEIQWDGGPTYSIHGHSTRRLPNLPQGELWYIPGAADDTLWSMALAF